MSKKDIKELRELRIQLINVKRLLDYEPDIGLQKEYKAIKKEIIDLENKIDSHKKTKAGYQRNYTEQPRAHFELKQMVNKQTLKNKTHWEHLEGNPMARETERYKAQDKARYEGGYKSMIQKQHSTPSARSQMIPLYFNPIKIPPA